MKQLFVFGSMLFCGAFASAQFSKFDVSLSAGPSFPLANFSSSKNYHPAAYAKTGIALNGEVNYHLSKQFGMVAQYRFAHHAVNTKAMDYIYAAHYTAIVHSDSWKLHTVLLGASYALPLNKRLCLEAALKTGGLKTTRPQMTEQNTEYDHVYYNANGTSVIGYDTVYTFITRSEVPVKWTLAGSATAKLKYRYSKKLQLITSVDYLYCNTSTDSETITSRRYLAGGGGRTPESLSTMTSSGTHKQIISSLSFLAGVQLSLER